MIMEEEQNVRLHHRALRYGEQEGDGDDHVDDHGEKEDMVMMRMPLTNLHDNDGDVL